MKTLNLSLMSILILFGISCGNKTLNSSEEKFVGTWVEVKKYSTAESFTFSPNRNFKRPSLSHWDPRFSPVAWESDGKILSLKFRLNKFLLGHILPYHKTDYQIRELTDTSAILYAKANNKRDSSEI